MTRKRSAFTLLETTIALSIVCFLVAISTWNLKDYQAKVAERQSLNWFRSTFKSAMNYAYLHNRPVELAIDATKGNIIFVLRNKHYEPGTAKKLTLPKTLKIISKNNQTDYYIHKMGDNQTFKIRFQSQIDQKIYDFKVLTSWGEIIETQT